MEIDDASGVHWALYSYGLIPAYRVMSRSINVFWDSLDPESKLPFRFEMAASCGFQPVDWESLNGRFTVFDVYHTREHARQVAVWKRRGGELLGFIADDVVTRLGDTAPDVGEKLYSALKALDTAENAEDLAHVMTSCRRVFEYVTDALFPPVPGGKSEAGRDIGAQNYRNRLLAFADKQHQSGTNIDLIVGSKNAWSEQLEKLGNLANKGVHAKVLRSEARRCLIKTIMLLDDVAGLRSGPFEFQGHFER